MRAIRVLLVDDHVPFRKAVAEFLNGERGIELVGEAGDGAQALSMARELAPDVVLMDLSMPHVDGLEATRRIKAEMPRVCVVIFTAHGAAQSASDAVRSGAQGYVLKSAGPMAILRALREVGLASFRPEKATRSGQVGHQ